MKVSFFGYDFAFDTLTRLPAAGHEIISIHSFPCDGVFMFNAQLRAWAQERNIPFTEEKPVEDDLRGLAEKGVEVILSAGYLYKIPTVPEAIPYAINIHPSALPRARGIMPMPHILLEDPSAAGITAHKLTDIIDGGDILLQETLVIHPQETTETLSCRIAMRMPDIAVRILGDIDQYWQNAQPQDESRATLIPAPDGVMRSINWQTMDIEAIEALHRAFGRYGILIFIDDASWAVYNLKTWPESHNHTPGHTVYASAREIVIAAKNGYVCLLEAEKFQQ